MSTLNSSFKLWHIVLALSWAAMFASAPQHATGQQSIMSADQDNFRIELLGCARDYETIQCKYRLTNTGRIDVKMSFEQEARIVTTGGDEAKSIFFQFGSNSGSGFSSITKDMVTNVPILASHKFGQTPRNSNNIAVLEINLYSYLSNSHSKIQFRNINVNSLSR